MQILGAIKRLEEKNKNTDLSYMALRRWIGILGMLLAVINIFGGWFFARIPIQGSISIYYYTNMRDFFVGLLFVVSLFLITYKGETKIDNVITVFTGFMSLGVALFPCYNEMYKNTKVGIFQLDPGISDKIHLICAGLFFLLLSINSIFLFTKTYDIYDKIIIKKVKIFFIVCGLIIFLSILGIMFSIFFMDKQTRSQTYIVIILEFIALIAFGFSWLMKGITIKQTKILA